MAQEGLLEGVQPGSSGQALDGVDSPPFGLQRQRDARVDEEAVQEHRASAAVGRLADALGPHEALAAQHVEQRVVHARLDSALGTVEREWQRQALLGRERRSQAWIAGGGAQGDPSSRTPERYDGPSSRRGGRPALRGSAR